MGTGRPPRAPCGEGGDPPQRQAPRGANRGGAGRGAEGERLGGAEPGSSRSWVGLFGSLWLAGLAHG